MSRTTWREYRSMACEHIKSLQDKIEQLTGTRTLVASLGGSCWKLFPEQGNGENVVFVGSTWEELYYQVTRAEDLIDMLIAQKED